MISINKLLDLLDNNEFNEVYRIKKEIRDYANKIPISYATEMRIACIDNVTKKKYEFIITPEHIHYEEIKDER